MLVIIAVFITSDNIKKSSKYDKECILTIIYIWKIFKAINI